MLPLHETIVYGPVRSRRLGSSLGINILPAGVKVCNFNCPYCQYGWTRARDMETLAWPTPFDIGHAVATTLNRAGRRRGRIDRLTLAGHGEPTLHPAFEDVVNELRSVRDRLAPGTPLAILSNASMLHIASVRRALGRLDERYLKLDAGNAVTLRRVNASPVALEQLLDGLRAVSDIIIQTMFVSDRLHKIDNSNDTAVADWIDVLRLISPRTVHIYTIDRPPACSFLHSVPAARLQEIARRVRDAEMDVIPFVPPGTPAVG